MATTFSTGTQSPTSHKTIEKIYEEAQSTGAICLCGRKLREYPKIAARYDLIDTISADLSKNRLTEVPKEVCDHAMLEELNCYHNVIKGIPEFIVQLQNLTFLNLSRNQLVVIPPFISQLVSLEVLIASHNKLISLPEEMGVLEKLMEIDVSCNEIAQLPPQIGDLKSLKSLNVRRNILLELPIEISKLSLRKIDFSNNRIATIPTAFRKIETLEVILLDNNPLTVPPAHLCTKGRKHIMKYLQIEAIKEDRRRGVLNEAEMKRLVRKSLPVQQTSDEFRTILESPEKWKRHTVLSSDSGYSTTDSIEKCGWSASEANSDAERAKMLATRSAEPFKDHRLPINGHVQSPTHMYYNPTSTPQPVKTSTSQNAYGQYGNNYNNNSGQYNNMEYHGNTTNSPSVYQTSSINSSSDNQIYRQNSYTNSQNYNPSPQYSVNYSRNNEVPSSIPGRQQSQYSPQSPNTPQQSYYGQYTASNGQYSNPGQQSESKSSPLSPSSMQSRYSQSPNSFQYSPTNTTPNVNYRVIPPPVVAVNPSEMSPEPSPNSPLTPKTPTPGYYQSGYGYSPSYGGYSTGSNSPNGPITPVNTSNPHNMEDEISRELQRQQAEYNRKKQQAEQIRMQHEEDTRRREEEEEKENCRRTALKVQEEQRLLLERQMEEERQREEARIQEERRQQEEAHRKEEQRKREDLRLNEEQRRKDEEKQKQEAQQYKVENNYGYNQGWHERPGLRYNGHTPESYSMQYRKPGLKSSSGLSKEEKKTSNSTQYRRTVSDSAKKLQQPANKKSNVVKNGPLSPSSSSPSTPLISPSPSPRSSVGSAGPSPASSVTSLNKDPKSTGGSIPRRPRTVDKNSTSISSRPSTGTSRPSTTSSVQSNRTTSRTTLTNSATKKNHVTHEEEFKQKHAQLKTQTHVEAQKAKSHLESSRQRTPASSTSVPRSSTSNLSKRGGTVLSNSAMKVIESYKDSDLNYTMRRHLEHEHGEAKHMDSLRRTIETRLKVTLPDNLPETLRDGVLLCQLVNNIRPRSVTSIHVPSPAVPKLTMAKCRKNVENFIEACRKLGVHREQICGTQDILEEKGTSRLAVTISALIAVSNNPRSSAV